MTSCPAPEILIASDRGELPPEQRDELDMHLRTCRRCRDELQLLDALRTGIERHGVATRHEDGRACPDEMRIARFAEGHLTASERDEVVQHLVRCGHCLTLLDAALLEVSEWKARAREREATGHADHSLMRWIRTHLAPHRLLTMGAPALAAAIVLIAVISPGLESPTDLSGLARIEPLPVRHVRGGADPDSFESIYRRALLDYDAGDYAAAVPGLARARGLRPEAPEPSLYLGSALLLGGDPSGAREVLEPLSRLDPGQGNPRVIEEARWLLGQACLELDDRGCAMEALEGVEALGGRHRGAARALLREL